MNINVKKNVIKIVIITCGAYVTGLLLTFILSNFIAGDPIIAYLPEGRINWEVYEQIKQQLGFNDPLFIQFFRFFFGISTGDLGRSSSIARMPVLELLVSTIPSSLVFPLLPIVLGLIAGIFLGILSIKVRSRGVKLLIQILIILGISMPMFLIGMWFQYTFAFQLGLFPTMGNPFLPSCILLILITFLTTRQVRSNYLKPYEEKNIWSNSLNLLLYSTIIITSIFILGEIYNLPGFFSLLTLAFKYGDFWVIRSGISILVLLLIIILLLSNIGYTVYNYLLDENKSMRFTNFFGRSEQIAEESARYSFNSENRFANLIIYRLKSPLTIIGLVIIAFVIVVAIFPQVLTPFSEQEAIGIYPDAWAPPSATHPLGQTQFGRDVLALLAYGVSTSVKVNFISVLIGIVIGTSIGYLAKVHRIVKQLVLGSMVIFFIVPSFIMLMFLRGIIIGGIGVTIGILALYTIPGVTLLISQGNYSFKLTLKKLVVYLPLFLGINIIIFEAAAFSGFTHYSPIQLGDNIDDARQFLYLAPWAAFWPGLALFFLIIGFISLHLGMKEPIPIAGRL